MTEEMWEWLKEHIVLLLIRQFPFIEKKSNDRRWITVKGMGYIYGLSDSAAQGVGLEILSSEGAYMIGRILGNMHTSIDGKYYSEILNVGFSDPDFEEGAMIGGNEYVEYENSDNKKFPKNWRDCFPRRSS